jgi:LacI family transcriptional regulator
MRTRKRITIRQVAREARVSTQTVSRVINNRPDVAPETRLRVERVIAQLGYRPSAIARSLIHQRSHTLGVVATGLDYFGPSRTLVGIERQVRAQGYSLLLDLLHHPETEDVERIMNRLLTRQVDGILWAIPEIGNNRAWLTNTNLHLQVPVVFTSMDPLPGMAIISIDNRLGGRLACDHLIAQGYQHIGIITGPLDWWEARQRRLGWQDALQEGGLFAGENQVVEGDWSAASGERGIHLLLEQFPEMQAVFSSNDQMALGILQAAHAIGRRVPGDLAVVGFDNIPESAYFWPALTTVSQPLVDLGCRAVEKLTHLIDAEHQETTQQPEEPISLQPKLIIRDSSVFRPVNELDRSNFSVTL